MVATKVVEQLFPSRWAAAYGSPRPQGRRIDAGLLQNKSPARWGDTGRGLDVRIAAAAGRTSRSG